MVWTAFVLGACAGNLTATRPAPLPPICYQSHWAIPLEFQKVRAVGRRTFTTHTGTRRFITVYSPGPFERSLFFVMSPNPSDQAIRESRHYGVMMDLNQSGSADCFILSGGTLPDAEGRPIPYNFFAIDPEGRGKIQAFISEDLDLNGDRVMDDDSRAVLNEPDADGRFQKGTYLSPNETGEIPKSGSAFLLRKPLWDQPVPFEADEVTQMTLFSALQDLWVDLQHH